MKNLIIVLLSVGLFFGFVLLPQVVTAQIKAPQESQRKRSYEPKFLGGKVNWMTFEEAEKAQKEQPKKVFVKVYAEWCGWCKRLDKATFADKRVADYLNENYYAVKFDAQHPDPVKLGGKEYTNPKFDTSRPKNARNATHQLALKYGARSYPTLLFLNEKMGLIRAIPGYRDADAFLPILEQFNQTTITATPPEAKPKPALPAIIQLPKPEAEVLINWMTFEEAQAAMKNKPKKLLVDVYTHWCGPCKMMDRNTFSNPKLAEYINENYYPVKFNAQEENDIVFSGKTFSNPDYNPEKGQHRRNAKHQLAVDMNISALPTIVILNERLDIIHSTKGYKEPKDLRPVLEQFSKM